MKRITLSLALLLFSFSANISRAATFNFDSVLSLGDFNAVMEEFSANFLNSTVSPPSTFGKKILPEFGFQVGVVGGITKSPAIDRLVSTEKLDKIPHAGILAAVTGPYGITLDGLFVPSIDISDVSMDIYGFGAKWTITEVFWEWLPISLAARFHYNSTEVKYSQTINNSSTGNTPVAASVTVGNDVWGFNVAAGYPLWGFFEPYLGIGYANGNGDLTINAAGGATFLGTDITATNTAEVSNSSFHFFTGMQLHFLIMNLGVEYNRVFNHNRYTAKFSFDF